DQTRTVRGSTRGDDMTVSAGPVSEPAGGGRSYRRRWVWVGLVIFLLALIAAAGVAWSARPQQVVVTLEVSRPSGLKLQGTADVDGHPQDLTGTVPVRVVLQGSRITYS